MRKPRPLAVIRNRRLNNVALLDPLRPVQFSAAKLLAACCKIVSCMSYEVIPQKLRANFPDELPW